MSGLGVELGESVEVILPELGEVGDIGFPGNDLLRGHEVLEFDEDVVLDGDGFRDKLDLGLEGRNLLHELGAELTRVGTD